MTAANFSHIRASDRDRDRAVSLLQTAYAEGRLTKDEYDARIGRVLSAQVYAQLDHVTADLVAPRLLPVVLPLAGPRRTNSMAVAALICGVAQPFTGMLTTLPAIVLGHAARRQIRRNGEDGAGLAAWGLALGWAGLLLIALVIIAIAALIAHAAGPAAPVPQHAIPAPG
jgi:hypothetical protein